MKHAPSPAPVSSPRWSRSSQILRRIDFRVVLGGLLVLWLCVSFWLGSRYPALQGKANADPNEALSSPLGFERHFPEPPADQTLTHLAWTALEWAVTNRQGMTFGLLLAAALLTLLPLLPTIRGGRYAGALQGVLLGTPMGVCVNCAAPISQGMLQAGSRIEVALSTLFSSPTFNVIVLGILLTIFPWYLAALKIASGLLMALAVSPWLAALAERRGWQRPLVQPPEAPGMGLLKWLDGLLGTASLVNLADATPRPTGLWRSIGWLLLAYPRNLWRVLRIALPLMLLAGLLGAVLVELLPWNALSEWSRFGGIGTALAVLVVVTAFSVLLPVPMAFDIVICSVLFSAGVPVHIVAALLVTLGIYSVYPWMLLGKTLSWRIASLAGAAVFVLGLLAAGAAALIAHYDELWQAQRAAQLAGLPVPAPTPVMLFESGAAPVSAPALAPPKLVAESATSELWHAPFEPALAGAVGTFTRLDGARLGLRRLGLPRPYLAMQPGPMHLGALAGGDVNGDGWPDLVVGSHQGVLLYLNTGGRFELQSIDFPRMRNWAIGVVALVDLDGDGALDLFFSAWKQGSFILFNRDGRFSEKNSVHLPGGAETIVSSVAFADVDRDGRLDIVTGAASFASWFFYPETAVNHLWRNRGGGRFEPEALPGPRGDTLSLLFMDLNGDGWPDLLVGNDFDEPDRVFLNDHGRLRPVTRRDSPLPYSATTTMSFDSGDIDNDGEPELYIGQIAMGRMNELPGRQAAPLSSCAIHADPADRARCDRLARFQGAVVKSRDTWSLGPCEELTDAADRRDCAVTAYHWQRLLVRLPASGAPKSVVMAECERIPADFKAMHDVCAAMALSPIDRNQSHKHFPDELPSHPHSNLLFARRNGGYTEVTNDWRVGFGGWTWNARFADLDNDGWLDLFITQGTRLRLRNTSLVYYRNQGGRRFEEATHAAGFEDHTPSGASLFMDIDQDGDLDVVTYPFQLTPVVWLNNGTKGQAIEVAIDDRAGGNRHGIGARVEIRSADGRKQVRDIKASGGYASQDVTAARFGLGDWPAASHIRVTWPDGSREEHTGRFSAGRYTLVRRR